MCVWQGIALDDRWIMELEKNGGESWSTSWENIGVIQLREEGGNWISVNFHCKHIRSFIQR